MSPNRLRRGGQLGAPSGFSLVELMVSVAILAILLAAATPAYNGMIMNSTATQYANNLMASTMLARSEAIKRNAPVSLCVSADGASCGSGGWEQGWLVTCSTSDQVACDSAGSGTLVIEYQRAAKAGWKITEAGGLRSITFEPSGTGATAASLTVCRATPSVGTQQRVVRISATGRPSTTKTTDSVCL
ncbi:type IV fimbrial biogenesis protein FimT [Janthinobacterium sp. CG_23.3]|uniref:GspH/FimT family pseudopilin n=1 Tax=Janthinobacterium sp. CG_23.3 TaxID=3349634 RepID=UPI0038D36E96